MEIAEFEIGVITRALIASRMYSREALASQLEVSLSSVVRWLNGETVPRPDIEGKIRALAAEHLKGLQTQLFPLLELPAQRPLHETLKSTLGEMRETLHRSGRLSSRHEALDEVAKLLFAHVMSVCTGGPGISNSMVCERGTPAVTLRGFVSASFEKHLPKSLSHELKPGDFELRIKPSEDRFALEVIDCFGRLATREAMLQIRGADGFDVLNDTFGQFLADSFTDEKELGQYLTPTEVVKFMVRLGLNSLTEDAIKELTDPSRCENFGLIIDPSCGVGSFLAETLRVLQRRIRSVRGSQTLMAWTESMMRNVLVGIDKSERMIKLALTNLALFGVPAANLHLANSLDRSGPDARLTHSLEGKARLILTNPPFGAEFSGKDLLSYKLATQWATRPVQSIDSELLFLERYVDWLAPGGVVLAIVPDSILTNKALFADLRNSLASRLQLQSVVSLPSVTFGVAGTNTKTSILHLKAVDPGASSNGLVYFAVCRDIGFDVITRGSHRQKVPSASGELPTILEEACDRSASRLGRLVDFSDDMARWDATYHAGMPLAVHERIQSSMEKIRVCDVAGLSRDRLDPRRLGVKEFDYIEISDVDAKAGIVRANRVSTTAAPSRARKRVRSGDVLISTVRPERRTIAVVPPELDGAICSTGFAVLRCTRIEPLVLAALLTSDFANAQMMRNNMGIAYPALEEDCILEVVLPVTPARLAEPAEAARALQRLRVEIDAADREFRLRIESCISEWEAQDYSKSQTSSIVPNHVPSPTEHNGF